MKKFDWNHCITWKDYGILCLVALVCYIPLLIWYLIQYWKMKRDEKWFVTTPIINLKNEGKEES